MAALTLDSRIARQQTMFSDATRMSRMQDRHISQTGGHGLPLRLEAGQTTTIDGRQFTASVGNSIQVTVTGNGYCIRVANEANRDTPVVYDSRERGVNDDPFGEQPGGACG